MAASPIEWLGQWRHRWGVVGVLCAAFFLAVVLISFFVWQVDPSSAFWGSFWLTVLFSLKYIGLAFFSAIGQARPRAAALTFVLVGMGTLVYDLSLFWVTFSPHPGGQISLEFIANAYSCIPYVSLGFLVTYFIIKYLSDHKKI